MSKILTTTTRPWACARCAGRDIETTLDLFGTDRFCCASRKVTKSSVRARARWERGSGVKFHTCWASHHLLDDTHTRARTCTHTHIHELRLTLTGATINAKIINYDRFRKVLEDRGEGNVWILVYKHIYCFFAHQPSLVVFDSTQNHHIVQKYTLYL